MAYSSELKSKMASARRLENRQLPELPYDSIRSLFIDRLNWEKTWLTYINSNNNRVELSYREFCGKTIGLAHFMNQKGLRSGDRVATVSHNHWHTVVQYFAAWLLGVVVVPVNVGEDDERISYIIQHAGVKLAFVREDYRERMHNIINSDRNLADIEVCIIGDKLDPYLKSGTMDELPGSVSGEANALIVYTSGTTGNPKGVLLSQNNLMEDARSISEWHSIDPESRMMCVLPIHHVNGTVVTLVTPFYAGSSVVLAQKFRVGSFFRIIQEEGVHIVSVVPTLLQFLNNEYKEKKAPIIPGFSHFICGAGPLTVNVAQQFEDTFSTRIIHGYGLSETTCYSCYLPLDLDDREHKTWMRDYGYPSMGIPLPVNEMQIHDAYGNLLSENERGEIVIRGVNVMKEYFGNEDANEKAFTYGWFRSGDEGFYKLDKKGRPFFFITGRLKELIIRGGINLSPLEIDEIIGKAPGVETGIAVGFENDWYGEEVGAYVKMRPGEMQDAARIIKFCAEKLPFMKKPKVVVFGDDIPVTSTGKYQRLKIAGLFSEWKNKQFKK
ncbi:MAG: class I adenylate-forming enzyme family protein [Balneolales bacterium]